MSSAVPWLPTNFSLVIWASGFGHVLTSLAVCHRLFGGIPAHSANSECRCPCLIRVTSVGRWCVLQRLFQLACASRIGHSRVISRMIFNLCQNQAVHGPGRFFDQIGSWFHSLLISAFPSNCFSFLTCSGCACGACGELASSEPILQASWGHVITIRHVGRMLDLTWCSLE